VQASGSSKVIKRGNVVRYALCGLIVGVVSLVLAFCLWWAGSLLHPPELTAWLTPHGFGWHSVCYIAAFLMGSFGLTVAMGGRNRKARVAPRRFHMFAGNLTG
jgi:hypothetical protein